MITATRPGRAGAAGRSTPAAAAAAPFVVARQVPLEPGFYAFGLAASPWRDPLGGLGLPAIEISQGADSDAGLEITSGSGRPAAWLGGAQQTLFIKAAKGGAVLVTAYLARDAKTTPLELQIARLDNLETPAMTLSLGGPVAEPSSNWSAVEIVTHHRGNAAGRFVAVPWAGRAGPGVWIEAFALIPYDTAAAEAIEYKGVSAGGTETSWLASGIACGTPGGGVPLTGFAVRQKTVPSGARFDCEYFGYFSSGATMGPVRNGAPCRSPRDNDPLEGMQLRVTERRRPVTAEPGRS